MLKKPGVPLPLSTEVRCSHSRLLPSKNEAHRYIDWNFLDGRCELIQVSLGCYRQGGLFIIIHLSDSQLVFLALLNAMLILAGVVVFFLSELR